MSGRFLKVGEKLENSVSIIFSLEEEVGALAKTLKIFKVNPASPFHLLPLLPSTYYPFPLPLTIPSPFHLLSLPPSTYYPFPLPLTIPSKLFPFPLLSIPPKILPSPPFTILTIIPSPYPLTFYT